jgi:hypothetical protein
MTPKTPTGFAPLPLLRATGAKARVALRAHYAAGKDRPWRGRTRRHRKTKATYEWAGHPPVPFWMRNHEDPYCPDE